MQAIPVSDRTPAGAPAQSPGYVLFLAIVAAISGFLFGFDTAVINGVLLFLRHQFALNDIQTEVAASALLLGCLLGAAGASMIGDRIGRRKSLLCAALLFAISTLGTSLANSIDLFSIGRLICGLAIGLASVLTPVYISEIAPAPNRGTLVSMNQLAVVVGILAAYFVSWKFAFLGDSSWRWMLGVAAIPSLAFFVGLLTIPESPRWLIGNGQRAKAEAVLTRIFGAKEAAAQVRLVEQAATTEDGSWHEVFAKPMRKRLGVALALAILCQVTGINTVLYYGSIIINEHFRGQSTNTALEANVIIGGTNLVVTIIALFFLDRWGRRPMLLTATAGMALSLATLVFAFHSHSISPMVMMISIICYVGFYAFGMGPVPWIIISEIFPNKIRGRAASIATSTLWTSTLVVTFTFLSLVRTFDISGTFAIYATLSLLGFVYIWRYVPESRGKTLEQIQHEWER
jgi:sugar porter (SP) family MFS transporter